MRTRIPPPARTATTITAACSKYGFKSSTYPVTRIASGCSAWSCRKSAGGFLPTMVRVAWGACLRTNGKTWRANQRMPSALGG